MNNFEKHADYFAEYIYPQCKEVKTSLTFSGFLKFAQIAAAFK